MGVLPWVLRHVFTVWYAILADPITKFDTQTQQKLDIRHPRFLFLLLLLLLQNGDKRVELDHLKATIGQQAGHNWIEQHKIPQILHNGI